MSEKHSCSAAICRRKHTNYNIHVKLDIMCRKKRGRRVVDIACAIHSILKSAKELKQRLLTC
jgi:hypothetical protein